MTALAQEFMTAEDFALWAAKRPEKHWELFDGAPQMQQAQSWGHTSVKYRIARAFDAAIEAAGLPLSFGVDGTLVNVGPKMAFQPDVVVFAGRMDKAVAASAPRLLRLRPLRHIPQLQHLVLASRKRCARRSSEWRALRPRPARASGIPAPRQNPVAAPPRHRAANLRTPERR